MHISQKHRPSPKVADEQIVDNTKRKTFKEKILTLRREGYARKPRQLPKSSPMTAISAVDSSSSSPTLSSEDPSSSPQTPSSKHSLCSTNPPDIGDRYQIPSIPELFEKSTLASCLGQIFGIPELLTAANKVLGISELLENILLDLPPRDLLLSQRVNSFFYDVIQNSTPIQQKLFFKATPPMEGQGAYVNPFFHRIIELRGGNAEYMISPSMPLTSGSSCTLNDNVEDHHVFARREPYWLQRDFEIMTSRDWHMSTGKPYHSWRKMVPVEPPSGFAIWNRSKRQCVSCHIDAGSMEELVDILDIHWGELCDCRY